MILVISIPWVGWKWPVIGGGGPGEKGEPEVLSDIGENEIRSFFTERLDVPALEG